MNQLQASRLGFAPPKAKTPPSSTGDAGTHLSNAVAAHKRGDHHAAKKHALAAVNMLHNMPQDGPAPAPGAGVATG
jgi:hypothetical protein